MAHRSDNGFPPKPLIGMPCARDKSQRHYGLPVFIQNQTYLEAIAEAGGAPITIPLHLDVATLRAIFDRLDGLFLAGGEDIDPASYGEAQHELIGLLDPERDRVELRLARWALAEGKPLLAVCRGMQVLNVATGGTLFQDIEAQRVDSVKHDYFPPQFQRNRIGHEITIDSNSQLAAHFGTLDAVNSMHHQALRSLGQGCRPVAWAPDGIVEALEVDHHPFAVGVQWHPEELIGERSRPGNFALFQHFVQQAQPTLFPGSMIGSAGYKRELSQVNLG